ncbi:hypothetical protein GCM10023149_16210 [Mucilaginibacter gynuensis]|uniref:Phosphoribosylpyrophosphate synthetase n=1 Tax=Mucilaginibacter gynuensis TaxID=1302236 RepID=A0ABP8G650_9SPHI
MQENFHYETVSEAIRKLRADGFVSDFNISGTFVNSGSKTFTADELEIIDLYRYEGVSDPADEALVFALATSCGNKGILVTGYGPSVSDDEAKVIQHLHYRFKNV